MHETVTQTQSSSDDRVWEMTDGLMQGVARRAVILELDWTGLDWIGPDQTGLDSWCLSLRSCV